MLITDDEILGYIRTKYSYSNSYQFSDSKIIEEKKFIVVKDIHEVNEALLNLEKDIYVRDLYPNRQTNCGNIRMICDSLNVESGDLGDEIYKELEKYNKLYTKAYLRNGSRWIDLNGFFIACDKAKQLLGNKNPRVFYAISKFSWMLSKQVLNAANVKLDYVNLRSQYELMYIEARKSNYDVIIQPVTTCLVQGADGEEHQTFLMTKYINNFALHKEMKFDHEHHVFGVVAGLAARKNRVFGKITSHYYQFRLIDLLKNEYAYLALDVKILDTSSKPLIVNGRQIAHKVLLRRKELISELSGFSRKSAKLILGGLGSLPETKNIYNYENPIELDSIEESNLKALLDSGEGILVYLIDETLYDNFAVYDNINALSNIVVEKGEIYDANYNLFSVSYKLKNPKLTTILDYAKNLIPGHRANQINQIQRIKLFDSMMAQQKNAIIRTEQAEKALAELQKSSEVIKELNASLQEKVIDRTKELEMSNEARVNTFIILAHETKSPLTLINNYLNEFTRKNGETEEIKLVRKSISKLTSDVTNLFDLERIKKGFYIYNHNQVSDFSKIILDNIYLYKQYASIKGIQISQEIEEGVYVNADPEALYRIINNLIENSIKYTGKNGTISVLLNSINGRIRFTVKDSGIGIPIDLQTNIFEPYYQIDAKRQNSQGIGLGLSIVKKIVESLNGEIFIISDPELIPGTEISIQFQTREIRAANPISYSKKPEDFFLDIDVLEASDSIVDEKFPFILLIDDNLSLLNCLARNLNDRYNIYLATSGKEALEKMSMIHRLDLILSDVMMDQMTGFEFYKQIASDPHYAHIPLIFLTAKTTIDEKLKGLELGAIDYIEKPFLIEELINKIDAVFKILNLHRAASIHSAYKTILRENGNGAINELQEGRSFFLEKCNAFKLTKREIAIIEVLASGKSYKEIGEQLHIAEATVGTHISNIYKKMKVNNALELLNKLGYRSKTA